MFFGTGSATPLYFPSVRPGPNPRTDSLIAVDLKTGKTKWWQQLISGNQWSYDVAQPPLVYDGKVGGKTHHIVSVASMEGVWFAFDATTGKPFYQRVKVIDRVEHPSLQPGKPVTIYPSSIGGLNYSPASYDPTTNYVFNAAAETAVAARAGAADARAEAQQVRARRRLPRRRERQLRHRARRAGTTTARSARSTSNTGQRVWKFLTPEPERGGVDDDGVRARLRGRRRRQPARVRPQDRQGPVDVPDGRPDRVGPDDLRGRRQGVRRDHGRRHADVVERRHRVAAAGLHDRRRDAPSRPGRS